MKFFDIMFKDVVVGLFISVEDDEKMLTIGNLPLLLSLNRFEALIQILPRTICWNYNAYFDHGRCVWR